MTIGLVYCDLSTRDTFTTVINLFVESFLGLVQRRLQNLHEMSIPVYPSIIQMKQFELKAFDRISYDTGIKKIRRLGHSYEFEQIKNYVRGDDYRSINWKASSRRAQLMVNQYEDERAQHRPQPRSRTADHRHGQGVR